MTVIPHTHYFILDAFKSISRKKKGEKVAVRADFGISEHHLVYFGIEFDERQLVVRDGAFRASVAGQRFFESKGLFTFLEKHQHISPVLTFAQCWHVDFSVWACVIDSREESDLVIPFGIGKRD